MSRSRERFGELEDHPVAGSDPDHPGLVCIYKDLDSPPDHLRECLALRCNMARKTADGRCPALPRMPAGRRRHGLGQHGQGL